MKTNRKNKSVLYKITAFLTACMLMLGVIPLTEIAADDDIPQILLSAKTNGYRKNDRIYVSANPDYTLKIKCKNTGIYSVNVRVGTGFLREDKNHKPFGVQQAGGTKNKEEVYEISSDTIGKLGEQATEVSIMMTDSIGRGYQKTYYIYQDTKAPKLKSLEIPNVKEEFLGLALENAKDYSYYTNKKMKAEITMTDGDNGAGVKEIVCSFIDEYGKKQKEQTIKGSYAKVSIPENFKGFIFVRGVDQLGNTSEYGYSSSGIISESKKKHQEQKTIELKTEKPKAVDEDGDGLYSQNTNVKVMVKDEESGIKEITWKVLAPYDEKNNYAGKCEVTNDGKLSNKRWSVEGRDRNLITKIKGTIPVRNNSDNIIVEVKMMDRAGNKSREWVILGIEKSEPQIQVSFSDRGENGIYQKFRVATVEVTGRNFQEENVVFDITNTEKNSPKISKWKETSDVENPDKTKHTAIVTFDSDGEYTFDVSYKDAVGHTAGLSSAYHFVIDQKAPEIQVAMDTASQKNGYYTTLPTAVIRITDKNFDPQKVEIVGKAVDANNKKITFPKVNGWKKQKDTYTGVLAFTDDGFYEFSVKASDEAGNENESVNIGKFCVDRTNPKLEITGVEESKSYNGEIKPVIRISDSNFDPESIKVKLVGAKNGNVKLDGQYDVIRSQSGQIFWIHDFAKEKMTDDLYTLTVENTDLAGNKINKDIHFAVNRFGSVYQFGDAVEKIRNRYMKKAQDLTITETNVNELQKGSIKITLFRNGNPVDLKEEQDYTVQKSGGEGQWSQYQYTISKNNFDGDGTYAIVLSSTDKAGNINQSDETKEAEISFGIDDTAPVIMPVNLTGTKTYAAAKIKAVFYVEDNLLLKQVSVWLNGKKTEVKKEGDNYTIEVPESSDRQNIRVMAEDAAGNTAAYQISDLLITSNTFIRWYNNKSLFAASAGIGAGILCLAVLVVVIKKKKKEKKC